MLLFSLAVLVGFPAPLALRVVMVTTEARLS